MPESARIPVDITVESVTGDIWIRRGEPEGYQVAAGQILRAGLWLTAEEVPSVMIATRNDNGERQELTIGGAPGTPPHWRKLE